MFAWTGADFLYIRDKLGKMLVEHAPIVDVGEWHATDVRGMPALVTRELLDVTFELSLPRKVTEWQIETQPNLPWAEDHFQERVFGEPFNPGQEYKNWPWAKGYFDEYLRKHGVFSHTYMERFWPKWAESEVQHEGIRFSYGDLEDVVAMLEKNPETRQAYLPVFFPEDTGATHGERVPCTLGYHFIVRNGQLNCTYYLRSCDFVRYFQDDVYLAGRLTQWVWEKVRKVRPSLDMGKLLVHITSLHVLEGDMDDLTTRFG